MVEKNNRQLETQGFWFSHIYLYIYVYMYVYMYTLWYYVANPGTHTCDANTLPLSCTTNPICLNLQKKKKRDYF
jgi:hypothetical protein